MTLARVSTSLRSVNIGLEPSWRVLAWYSSSAALRMSCTVMPRNLQPRRLYSRANSSICRCLLSRTVQALQGSRPVPMSKASYRSSGVNSSWSLIELNSSGSNAAINRTMSPIIKSWKAATPFIESPELRRAPVPMMPLFPPPPPPPPPALARRFAWALAASRSRARSLSCRHRVPA